MRLCSHITVLRAPSSPPKCAASPPSACPHAEGPGPMPPGESIRLSTGGGGGVSIWRLLAGVRLRRREDGVGCPPAAAARPKPCPALAGVRPPRPEKERKSPAGRWLRGGGCEGAPATARMQHVGRTRLPGCRLPPPRHAHNPPDRRTTAAAFPPGQHPPGAGPLPSPALVVGVNRRLTPGSRAGAGDCE